MFSAVRSRPEIARTAQPLTILSRAILQLNNGFSSNSASAIAAQQMLYNPQDSKYYLLYGALNDTSTTTGQYGLAQATSPDGPWTDLGALSGPPTGASFTGVPQCKLLLTPDNKWSFYYVTSQSGTIGLYQTAAAGTINSTYTLTNSALIAKGGAGTFDNQRCSEPFVFQDQGGTWRLLYMGMDATVTYEQVGMAVSSGDHTGPYTKANGGNPVIPHGSAGQYDANISADPSVIYYGGTYYIFRAVGDTPASGGTSAFQAACVTTPDFVTFTKRGIVLPSGIAPAADCVGSWAGCMWWPGLPAGDNTFALPSSASTIYWSYSGKRLSNAPISGGLVQGYLAKIDAQSIFAANTATNPWTRIGAASGDTHLSWNGAAFTTFSAPQGNTVVFSNTTGNGQILTWTGRRARIYATENNIYGSASIWLDGEQVGTYDAASWSSNETNNCPVVAWDTGDLLPGSHTLEIRVTGTKNANSSGFNVGVVYWEYI